VHWGYSLLTGKIFPDEDPKNFRNILDITAVEQDVVVQKVEQYGAGTEIVQWIQVVCGKNSSFGQWVR
jgi:hypothetical protein